jgi:hypothetical protein
MYICTLGQEDIESLDKSIKLYADRLPTDSPGVRHFRTFVPANTHDMLGVDLSTICLTTVLTAVANIRTRSEGCTKSHSRH